MAISSFPFRLGIRVPLLAENPAKIVAGFSVGGDLTTKKATNLTENSPASFLFM
jgi:hypothetical protein